MLIALNHPHEIKLHVRGAIINDLTKDEIREVFLQAAIYFGFPAAIDSFRAAKKVFEEIGFNNEYSCIHRVRYDGLYGPEFN